MALVCVGCPNPNTYTTPRTIGHGRVSHSVAAEAWGFSVPVSNGNGTTTTTTATLPTFPTYTLRIGLGDSVELGGRIANLSSLGADIKWNFFRSRSIDLAFDPSGQVFRFGTTTSTSSTGGTTNEALTISYLHLPLLVGFNLSRTVSLVLAPGITYGHASASVNSTDGRDQASGTTGAIGRLGFGVDVRMSPGFALHPEVTFLRTLDSNAVVLYLVGLGFNFGSLPNYDDVDGPVNPPPPPAWAPPPGEPPPPPPPYEAAPPPPPPPPA